MEMNKFDKTLEFSVMAGFFAIMIYLANYGVPEANKELFSQALGAYTAVFTLVGKSIWDRNSSEAKLSTQRVDNTAKALDAIKAVSETTPSGAMHAAADAAEATAKAADEKAEEYTHGNAG
jgi:hypothetical protein